MQVSRFLTKWAYFSKFYCVSNGKQLQVSICVIQIAAVWNINIPQRCVTGKDGNGRDATYINEFSESIFEKEYLIKGF